MKGKVVLKPSKVRCTNISASGVVDGLVRGEEPRLVVNDAELIDGIAAVVAAASALGRLAVVSEARFLDSIIFLPSSISR